MTADVVNVGERLADRQGTNLLLTYRYIPGGRFSPAQISAAVHAARSAYHPAPLPGVIGGKGLVKQNLRR